MEELIAVADRKLMFGAKRAGKNSIFLIGGEVPPPEPVGDTPESGNP